MKTAAKLRLTLTNDGGDDAPPAASIPSSSSSSSSTSSSRHWFEQEGAKASYVIGSPSGQNPSSSGGGGGASNGPGDSTADSAADATASAAASCSDLMSIGKPAHALLECTSSDGGSSDGILDTAAAAAASSSPTRPFRYGGLELISNARNVEVYVTDADTGKERYVFTSRGIKAGDGGTEGGGGGGGGPADPKREWFKCVIVNPGGPATVSRVRLKLLSLKPNKCSECTVRLVKVKAKLPEVESTGGGASDQGQKGATSATTAATAATITTANAPAAAASGVPSAASVQPPMGAAAAGGGAAGLPEAFDIGAALSAVTMMVRSTEDKIVKSVTDETNRLDATIAARMSRLERKVDAMGAVMSHQNDKLNEQAKVIGEQRDLLAEQREAMEGMIEGQRRMMELMEGMAAAQIQATAAVASPAVPAAAVAASANQGQGKEEDTIQATGRGRIVVKKKAIEQRCEALTSFQAETEKGEEGTTVDDTIATKGSNDTADEEQGTDNPIPAAAAAADATGKNDAPESPSEGGWVKVKDGGSGSPPRAVEGSRSNSGASDSDDSRDGSNKGDDDGVDDTKDVEKKESGTRPVMTYRGATDLISFDNNDDAGAG